MTTIPNTNSHEEQMFLATLEECLQADNEKRTAAEVNIYDFSNLNFKKNSFFLLANLSRYTR
jgi:hypothetical protein